MYLNNDERGTAASPATNNKPSFTMADVVNHLTTHGSWGAGRTLTIAFLSAPVLDASGLEVMPNSGPGSPTSGFVSLLSYASDIQRAFDAWADVADVKFSRDDSLGTNADIIIGGYTTGVPPAFGFYPNSGTGVNKGLWINPNTISGGFSNGSDGYYTALHEIGHVLGLDHAGSYNNSSSTPISMQDYSSYATHFEDTHQYSVMSYFFASFSGAYLGSPSALPYSPMMEDIAAIQKLYGESNSRSGPTTYSWSTAPIISIFDHSGIDILDLSGFNMNQKIDLNSGHFSDVGGFVGNLSIAVGTDIENVSGGSAVDTIYGNSSNNVIHGNDGDDIIFTSGGSDFLFGDGGNDRFIVKTGAVGTTIDGGSGDNTLDFSESISSYTYDIASSKIYSLTFDVSITVSNIRHLVFAGGTSVINGTDGYDIIYSGDGNSTVYGGAGNDIIHGNTAFVGSAPNRLHGGDGDDLITMDSSSYAYGEGGNDTIIGSDHADDLSGGSGVNIILAGGQDDKIRAGGGANSINGGDNTDTVYYDFTQAKDDDGSWLVYAYNAGAYIEIGTASNERLLGLRATVYVDRIKNVEHIQFLDGELEIASLPRAMPVWTEKPFTYDNVSPNDPVSPLILDLDGDGVETISLANSKAMFDLIGNGYAIKTAWVGKDDGLLAFDVNGNGTIDSISELFGNKTTNGFSVLSAHDSNGDGVINASDATFGQLKVWKDANSDGISQVGELRSLADAGIASISLAFQNVNLQNNGNPVTHRSTFTWATGGTGTVDDVWFVNAPLISQQKLPDSYMPSVSSLTMPTLSSYGILNDFTYRLDTNATFSALAASAVAAGKVAGLAGFDQAFENLFMNWAGVDPASNPTGGKQFAVLRALHGDVPYSNFGNGFPGQDNVRYLSAEYATALQSMAGKFLVQVAARAEFEGVSNPVLHALSALSFDRARDVLVGDIDGTLVALGGLTSDSGLRDDAMRAARMVLQSISPTDPLRTGYIAHALTASGLAGGDLIEFRAMLEANSVVRPEDTTPEVSSYGKVLFYGTPGFNQINGSTTNDVFIGSTGGDILQGGDGNDTYVYRLSNGNLTIAEWKSFQWGDGGVDSLILPEGVTPGDVTITVGADSTDLVIRIGASAITLKGHLYSPVSTVDKVIFADGTEWTSAYMYSVISTGTPGDDNLRGNWLNNTLNGGAGNDTLYGNEGQDILIGGLGDDILNGGSNEDVIRYAAGDGNDVIMSNSATYSNDRIVFEAGITPGDVNIVQAVNGADLLISVAGGSILVKGGFSNRDDRLVNISFADGTVWSSAQIFQKAMAGGPGDDVLKGTELADIMVGGAGNDTLEGYLGNDTLTGGVGNDTLKSGPGDDIIHYALGDGDDTLINQGGNYNYGYYGPGADKVTFGPGIAVADVRFTQSGPSKNLIATVAQGGSITVIGGIAATPLASFTFSDGTVISAAAAVAFTMIGAAGNQTIYDTDGNDIIEGGLGDDTIYSGQGTDIFRYNLGDGNDVIWEGTYYGSDTLQFGSSLTPADVRFTYSTTDSYAIVARMPDGGTVTMNRNVAVGGGLNGAPAIETFKFSDGTSYTLAQVQAMIKTPTAGDDVLRDLSGTINALAGNDHVFLTTGATVNGGDGDDRIYGGANVDTLNGDAGDDYIDGGAGNDTINGGTGNDTLIGGQGIDTINGGDGNDVIRGEAVGDTVFTNDIISGGDGDDYVYGDVNDVTVTGDAGIDTIDLTASTAAWNIDLSLSLGQFKTGSITRNWTGFEKVLAGSGNDILKASAGTVLLSGGWGSDTIYGKIGSSILDGGEGNDIIYAVDGRGMKIYGGNGNDSIYGGIYANTINGGDGDDYISGGVGAETIDGGYGNDIIYGGGGANVIYGGWGDDRIQAGLQSGSGTDVVIRADGGLGNDIIYDGYGTSFIDGGDGDDIIYSYAGYYRGDDYSVGNQTLTGGNGNDTFYVSTINAAIDGGSGTDKVSFYFPNSTKSITVTDYGTHQKVTISGVAGTITYYGIENFSLAAATLGASTSSMHATGSNVDNSFAGGASSDLFFGGGGNDVLNGFGDMDILHGEDGDDILIGGAGDDILYGGAGMDVAKVDKAASWFTISTGSNGSITVTDTDTSAASLGTDTLYGIELLETTTGTIGLTSPIVLDLDGDGIHLSDIDSGVQFDMDGDGLVDQSGWFSQGDAVLVRDLDGDGRITTGAELSFTQDMPGALTDMQGLASHDADGNGRIDANDAIWSQLRLWIDDGDGIQQEGELLGLADAGVSWIGLATVGNDSVHALGESLVFGTGSFGRTNGGEGQVADAAFAYSPAATRTMAEAQGQDAFTAPEGEVEAGDTSFTMHQDDAFLNQPGVYEDGQSAGAAWDMQPWHMAHISADMMIV